MRGPGEIGAPVRLIDPLLRHATSRPPVVYVAIGFICISPILPDAPAGLPNPGIKRFAGGFQDVLQTAYSRFSGCRQDGPRTPTLLKSRISRPQEVFRPPASRLVRRGGGRRLLTVYSGFPRRRGSVSIFLPCEVFGAFSGYRESAMVTFFRRNIRTPPLGSCES